VPLPEADNPLAAARLNVEAHRHLSEKINYRVLDDLFEETVGVAEGEAGMLWRASSSSSSCSFCIDVCLWMRTGPPPPQAARPIHTAMSPCMPCVPVHAYSQSLHPVCTATTPLQSTQLATPSLTHLSPPLCLACLQALAPLRQQQQQMGTTVSCPLVRHVPVKLSSEQQQRQQQQPWPANNSRRKLGGGQGGCLGAWGHPDQQQQGVGVRVGVRGARVGAGWGRV
jgi:hypothetical protein